MADEEVPALVNSAYPEDAYIARTTLSNGQVAQGSAIALFGCKARNMLNTIEEIELNEDLAPSHVDGEWIKKAPAIKGLGDLRIVQYRQHRSDCQGCRLKPASSLSTGSAAR